jgi:hypothetical protein
MASLHASVRRACEVERLGGVVTCRDAYTCIVSNCACVCSEQLEEIARRHPRVSFVVKACDSGFLVVFCDNARTNVLRSADFFAILVSGIAAAVGVSLLV